MKPLLFCFIFLYSSFLPLSYGEHIRNKDPSPEYIRIELPPGADGPESLAFDCNGQGPYTGVADGRILKWQSAALGWTEFAVTAANRNRDLCDGSIDPNLGPICGRPLGLQFSNKTCELYIADAYFGLMKVGRSGGVATQLASSAEGVPFKLTNGLDVDQQTGVVYFSDSSSRFQLRDYLQSFQTKDNTGRLMKYDPRTRKVKVLLRGLRFANGVALSMDNSYVLVAETATFVIQRYWLKGHNAGRSEVFSQVLGPPDNIKRNSEGEYWVGVYNGFNPSLVIVGVRLDEGGRITRKLIGEASLQLISEVNEINEWLLLGSVGLDFMPLTNTLVSREVVL